MGPHADWVLPSTVQEENRKKPSDTFRLGTPAPGGRSMPRADGKNSFQPAGAEAASQDSPDTQQTANIPKWTLCSD